jgi:small redox-active disulfide protein 2
MNMKIQVLGSGCANCHKTEEIAKQAVAQLGINAQVELVTDVQAIMRYGVMNTLASSSMIRSSRRDASRHSRK